MKEVLQKLKLIDHLTTQLEIQKNEFVNKLKENVDEGDTGLFSNMLDPFSSSKNEYKGQVTFDNFKIKKRGKFFTTYMNMAVAKGTYRQKDNYLIIETEINGFSNVFIPFCLFLLAIYLIIIVQILFTENTSSFTWFAFPALLFHAAFMMGIPYMIMRRSTKSMKYELEREFFYMTKK